MRRWEGWPHRCIERHLPTSRAWLGVLITFSRWTPKSKLLHQRSFICRLAESVCHIHSFLNQLIITSFNDWQSFSIGISCPQNISATILTSLTKFDDTVHETAKYSKWSPRRKNEKITLIGYNDDEKNNSIITTRNRKTMITELVP